MLCGNHDVARVVADDGYPDCADDCPDSTDVNEALQSAGGTGTTDVGSWSGSYAAGMANDGSISSYWCAHEMAIAHACTMAT